MLSSSKQQGPGWACERSWTIGHVDTILDASLELAKNNSWVRKSICKPQSHVDYFTLLLKERCYIRVLIFTMVAPGLLSASLKVVVRVQ